MTGRMSMGYVVFSGRGQTTWGAAGDRASGGPPRHADPSQPGLGLGSIAKLAVVFG